MTDKLKVLLLPLIAAAGVLIGVYTLSHPYLIHPAYAQTSYYIIGLIFSAWCVAVYQYLKQENFSVIQWIKENITVLLFILALCALVFVSIKPQFRILKDEIDLISISRSMFYEKRVDMIYQSDFFWLEYLYSMEYRIGQKPLLFPFFLHLVHAVSGYRLENAFALNFLVLMGLLIMAFVFVRKRLGSAWASTVLILLIAQPVIPLTATSGIYDLFAVFFLLVCYLSLDAYRRNPTETSFRMLWMNLIMLAHIRYESFLFLAVTFVCALIFGLIRWEYFKKSYVYALTPLFVLPLIWLKWRLPDNVLQVPTHEVTFSFEKFLLHNFTFLKIFTEFSYTSPYAGLVCLTGLIGVIFFTIKLISSRESWPKGEQAKYGFIYLANIIIHWILISSFHAARPMSGVIGRYYLIFIIFLTISAVFFLKAVHVRRPAAIGLAILMFILYQPVSLTATFLRNTSANARIYRLTMDVLKQINDKKALLVVQDPQLYIVDNRPAVGFTYANREKIRILRKLRTGAYSDVYVVQYISRNTLEPVRGTALASEYQLETIAERRFHTPTYIRISKVVR